MNLRQTNLKRNPRIHRAAAVLLAAALVFTGLPGTASALTSTAPEEPSLLRLSWTDDPKTTMTVTWQDSASAGQAWVEYIAGTDFPLQRGGSGGDGRTAEPGSGVSVRQAGRVTHRSTLTDGGTQWTATLTGLTPGTTYTYRVCSAPEQKTIETPEAAPGLATLTADAEPSAIRRSAVSQFTTETADRADSLKFVYFGDVQVSREAEGEFTRWGQMAQDVLSRNPDLAFGLMGGDIVESGISTAQFDMFFDAASPVFSTIPLLATNGNHESNFLDGKPQLYLDSFTFPENGPEGFKEEFYSLDYGRAHILVLNSWVYSGEQKISEAQYASIKEWIRQDLRNEGDDSWKIVVMHHPLYAVHSDRVANLVKENWAPLLEEGGVDLLLCGHQHVYCRSFPLTGGLVDYENGITQVMGVSGEKFYSSADENNMERTVYEESNYQIIRIDGNSLELQCFNRNGEELDYATLSRNGGQNPAEGAERFKDVSKQDWFWEAVDFVARQNYFTGVSETEFLPSGMMTRAMFATVISRLEGIDAGRYTGTSFSDVATGQWYSAAVEWASQNGIVLGTGDGKFHPDGEVTREQMATIMYRYANFKKIDTSDVDAAKFAAFSDNGSVSAWAVSGMCWATSKEIIRGVGNSLLAPGSNATRAQVAQIVKNYSEKIS